jgi:hypothetical protein
MSSVVSFRRAGTSAVSAVSSAVPAVQEVEQRTREDQQPRQHPEDVGPVLAHEEKRGDDQEGEEHQTGP